MDEKQKTEIKELIQFIDAIKQEVESIMFEEKKQTGKYTYSKQHRQKNHLQKQPQ